MSDFFSRLSALIRKEMLAIFKNPESRVFVLLPPFIQIIIFGYAATLDLTNINYGFINRDRGSAAREVLAGFNGSGIFKPEAAPANEKAMADLINRKTILEGLTFQEDFTRKLLNGQPAEVQAVFDGRNSNSANIAMSYTMGVISEFNAEFREKHNLPQPAIRLEKRTWYNPNYNMRFFMIPALLAVLAMLDTMMMSSLSIAREREEGTFDQLLVAPYRPSEIIAAKAATYVLVGLVQMTMIFLISLFWYRIPFHGSIALLYLGLVTFILAAVGAGLCISALSNTMQQAMMGMFLTAMPFTLLSGLATPIDSMNDFFQYLTMLNPMRYGIVIIHRIYLEGAGFLLLWRFFLYMFLIAAVTLCAANAIFKKQLHG